MILTHEIKGCVEGNISTDYQNMAVDHFKIGCENGAPFHKSVTAQEKKRFIEWYQSTVGNLPKKGKNNESIEVD